METHGSEKKNNTNLWSCPEPQNLVTRDSRQLHMDKLHAHSQSNLA